MLDGSNVEHKSIIVALDKKNVVLLWPQIEALLKPLVESEGYYIAEDILAFHLRDEMLIFVSWVDHLKQIEAVAVTQIITYPRMKACFVPYIAGKNLNAWKEYLQNTLENYARSNGCKRMGGGFRRGWVKIAGYKEVGCILVKDLI